MSPIPRTRLRVLSRVGGVLGLLGKALLLPLLDGLGALWLSMRGTNLTCALLAAGSSGHGQMFQAFPLAVNTPPSTEGKLARLSQQSPISPRKTGDACRIRCAEVSGSPVILPIFFVVALLWLGIPALVAQDAQRHGESGAVWWALSFFGGFIAIVAWLVVRRRLPLSAVSVTPLTRTLLIPAAVLSLAAFTLLMIAVATRPTSTTTVGPPAPSAPPSPR